MNIDYSTPDNENCGKRDSKQQSDPEETDNLNSPVEDDVQEVLADSYESLSSPKKQKHTKRHDKHHQFDDSEPFEEQHHKKRDSGKRRHRVKRKGFDSSDDLEVD
jgi:hypothetical protein